jgi:hypothetical protein
MLRKVEFYPTLDAALRHNDDCLRMLASITLAPPLLVGMRPP